VQARPERERVAAGVGQLEQLEQRRHRDLVARVTGHRLGEVEHQVRAIVDEPAEHLEHVETGHPDQLGVEVVGAQRVAHRQRRRLHRADIGAARRRELGVVVGVVEDRDSAQGRHRGGL
jgi:hypothetical protein